MTYSLPGLFGAGLLTFVSPCILPLVPLYLSFLAGSSLQQVRKGGKPGRIILASVAFSMGLASVFVALGMAASAAGQILTEHRTLLVAVGGGLMILFGLKFLGVIRLPLMEREARPWMNKIQHGGSLVAAFLFGAAFGLGWTPCVGPVLASVLTYTAAETTSVWGGALFLSVYAAGLVLPLILTAAMAPLALRTLDRLKPRLPMFEKVTGVAMVAFGLILFSGAFESSSPEVETASNAEIGAVCDPDAQGAVTCALPELDDATAVVNLTAPGGARVLQFTSQSCPICDRMAPIVSAVEESCPHQKFAEVDVGARDGRSLAGQFAVRGVPTYVFLDEAGQEVARYIGEQAQETLRVQACGS